MNIEARNITKRFGTFEALKDVSIMFPQGQLIGLLGPSGSGKTSLLRIIAGLESPDSGSVHFEGTDATGLRARDRHVGFVFQHYALFRHMTVFENVAFGLRVKPRDLRPSKTEIHRRVTDLLKLVQLDWLGDRLPSQLSGGQRQRVALARALAVEPKVLLLDEPFGALDAKVRKELRRWLRRLHDEIHVTSIFVTHDVEEALEVSDQVVVLNEGRVEQIGSPDEVYERPATPFVYRFLGSVNLFHARMEQGHFALAGAGEPTAGIASPLTAYVRPHEVELAKEPGPEPALAAEVVHVQAVGPIVRIELRRCDGGGTIEAELSKERYRELGLQAGERAYVRASHVRVFDQESARPHQIT
jgi:sulfate transport system ATP-binding protein